ncbi:MAG: DUF721 domain-containing protein [Gaiellaceae bacterium]
MTWLPERLGEAVRGELARFGPTGSMADVVAAWPAAVGDGIAANAWPARIARDGTLHVNTSSSAWAFELTQLREQIAESLAEALGQIAPTTFRFAPGPIPEAAAEPVKEGARTVLKVPPELVEEGRKMAAGIEDESLRGAVATAAAASLAARAANRCFW